MKMGKKVREYKAGDFIFAKVKGYPAWPARVQRPNGKKYFVYFYGTGETANLPPNMIFDYAENKDKFLSKAVKRRDFNDGVKQIQHDFANNVPLEQVIGIAMEVPEDAANDTANDSAVNDTMDETTADATAADDTAVADESAVDAAAPIEPMVEDSDEAGALVIDEGKKGRKSTVKPPPVTPKPMKEPKTPRGKKKEEAEENKEDEKKEEEIVSRSGRKIRPKRYIDEQTDENATLPSPASKKRRGASPDKDERGDKTDARSKNEKSGKQLNTITQAELEDLKEPFNSGDDKENILIAYLPQGQYVGIKLFQSRPTTFKNEPARLQWDKQQAQNAITLKQQLEKGQITSQSVITQLVMDLNLTDEEKATLDKERETEEKKSRVQFLKTEMKLIELEAKIKTCLCLEKADTELCLKLLDEFTELDIKPLMLLKHPSCGETVKRLRAYVGNAPSWELSESAALLFAKQAHRIRRRADALYRRVKELFTVPEGLPFWEFFSERVEQFKSATATLSPDELLELVHEPLDMSVPTSHTMRAALDAANEDESIDEDSSPKKKTTAKQKKPTNNTTPSKPAVKRQSSRKQPEGKEKDKEQNEQEKSVEATVENAEKESKDTDKMEETTDSTAAEQTTEDTVNSNAETNSENIQDDSSNKDTAEEKSSSDKDDTVKTKDNSSEKSNKTKDELDKDNKSKDESDKSNKSKDESDKANKSKDESDKANKSKDESDKANKSKDESEKVNKTKDESEKGNNKTKDESEKGNKTRDESEKGNKTRDESEKGNKTKDDSEKGIKNKYNTNKEQSKSKSPSPNEKEKDNNKSPKESKGSDSGKSTKEERADKSQKSKEDKAGKEEKTEKTEEKDKEDEPRAKRSRESKKTDVPPRSPTKRKSKY